MQHKDLSAVAVLPASPLAHKAQEATYWRSAPYGLGNFRKHGIATEGFTSKSWDNLSTAPDLVITLALKQQVKPALCSLAMYSAHFGMADPAKVVGSDEEIAKAFEDTFIFFKSAKYAYKSSFCVLTG